MSEAKLLQDLFAAFNRHDLDGVGDELSAAQRVAHPDMVHGDTVTNPDGVENHRRAASRINAGLGRYGISSGR